MTSEARTYRFGDAARPGLLLGLSGRQAIPLVAGVLSLAVVLQTPLPPPVGLIGPLLGAGLAWGRWRGLPISETLTAAIALYGRRAIGMRRWVRPPLLGDNTHHALPAPLRGLELLAPNDNDAGILRDHTTGSVTAVLGVRAHGFPLAASTAQDSMLASWGSALSPFAREGSPVRQVVWHEWSHPVTSDTHMAFLDAIGVTQRRAGSPAVADYVALVDEQSPVTIAHEVLIALTVDERKVRARRSSTSRLATAVDTLIDEAALFRDRLEAAGLDVDGPLSPLELSAAGRVRSDPRRAAQVIALTRSLAAAARRGALEWGPMVVEPAWGYCRVDGAYHRSYRVASWPRLPVGADWLAPLLTDTGCVRTVSVVMEPVPMGRAARAADREVMAREADGDMKIRRGFRVNARERKRLADAERRERELSDGHAEFEFVGLVTVTSDSLDALDDDCAQLEQVAAQCLLDLRPLDARHAAGWVASLPFGRVLAPRIST